MAMDTSMSSSAMDETEDEKKKKKQGQQSKGEGAASGAAAGASVGMAAGPVGALIGAGVGAAAGAADANQKEKAAASSDPNRPKHRRIQKGLDKHQETKDKRERALATLSQAVFDWAASIR